MSCELCNKQFPEKEMTTVMLDGEKIPACIDCSKYGCPTCNYKGTRNGCFFCGAYR